jgi:hypothetical protein
MYWFSRQSHNAYVDVFALYLSLDFVNLVVLYFESVTSDERYDPLVTFLMLIIASLPVDSRI